MTMVNILAFYCKYIERDCRITNIYKPRKHSSVDQPLGTGWHEEPNRTERPLSAIL